MSHVLLLTWLCFALGLHEPSALYAADGVSSAEAPRRWLLSGTAHAGARSVSPRFWPAHSGSRRGHLEAHLRRADTSATGRLADSNVDANDNVDDHVDEHVDKGIAHAEHTAEKIGSAPHSLPREVKRDGQLFRNSFLPNWAPDTWVLAVAIGFAVFGILWLVVYLNFLYESDRVEHLGRWADASKDTLDQDDQLLFGMLHKDKFVNHDLCPDIVIVFHHPTHESHSHATDDEVTPDTLHNVLVERGGDYSKLQEFKQFAELAHEGCEAVVAKETGSKLTRRLARETLLKDMYNFIPHKGFEEKIFQSIDHDELFVCISLTEEKVMDHYLRLNGTNLQVQSGVVEALGVSQPPEDPHSSPPYIPYDPTLATVLADLGVIEKDDPRRLYLTHKGRGGEGSIMSGLERIRVIYKEISKFVNLDAAKHQGIIVDWFPVHSYRWLHKLGASWSCFRHLTDMTFVQPLSLLNTYFGSRVAFSFAWNGLYCKMLLPITVLAFVVSLVDKLADIVDFHATGHLLHQAMSLSFTVVVITWSKIALNFWDREERFFMKLWNLNPETATPTVRPEFVGFLRPSQADRNKQELGQNTQKYQFKCWMSIVICLFSCVVIVVLIFTWLTIFEGRLNLFASAVLSTQIVILEAIFNQVAKKLTEWENHQFQAVFYESYLRKAVGLQFANSYTPFFYLAVRQRYSESGCPQEGCLEALRVQLTISLLVLFGFRIGQVTYNCVKVRWVLWKETIDLKEELGGAEPPMRCFAEEQAKYVEYRTQEQIEAFCMLMVSLGFVLIFGGVCPVVIPFCFAVFAVQLRASAFQLTTTTKRPVPRITFGIGAWRQVVSFLMQMGILFAAFLVVEYAVYFEGVKLITKVTGFMLFCCLMLIIWRIVDLFVCVAGEEETAILGARRRAVEQRITEAAVDERKIYESAKETTRSGDGGPDADGPSQEKEETASGHHRLRRTSSRFAEIVHELEPHDAIKLAVEHGDWEVIPRLDQMNSEEHLDAIQDNAKNRMSAF